jgi:hypothetical protein
MDINSASPDQVSPLPFHGMTKYPYEHPEAYPMTAARRAYLEKYNTRLVRTEIPSLDAVLNLGGSDLRVRRESGKLGAPTEGRSYNFLQSASGQQR